MVKSLLLIFFISFSLITAFDVRNSTFGLPMPSIVLEETDDVQTICKARKCIRKCCPKDEYFNKTDSSCMEIEGNFDFSNISVYDDNDYSLKINKTLSDIFLLEPGKFFETFENESFVSIMYVPSDLNFSTYLTEVSTIFI